MNLLLKYMIEGLDLKSQFKISADNNFKSKLEKHLESKFKGEVSFKRCPMNKDNYFLIFDDDEYKEIFGYEIVKDNLYFLEGMYMPENMLEVSYLLDFLSEVIKYSEEYSQTDTDGDSEEDTEWDFEWI